MADKELTPEEIERMREIVIAHDSKQPANMQQFDLAHPPVQPYRYQPFPKMVYHHDRREYKIVDSEEHLKDALGSGWQKEPYPEVGTPVVTPPIAPIPTYVVDTPADVAAAAKAADAKAAADAKTAADAKRAGTTPPTKSAK